VVDGIETPPGGNPGHDLVDGDFSRFVELDVFDPAAFDADQVVMVVLERLGQFVPGHTVSAVMGGDHVGVGEHSEGSVDRRERYRTVEVEVDIGGRQWSAGLGQGADDLPSSPGEADVGSQPVCDLVDYLRDVESPAGLIPPY
jgi:hypothetical protein